MKRLMAFAWLLAAGVAFAAGVDTDGNAITEATLFGDVDGAETTVGDVLGVGEFATANDLAAYQPLLTTNSNIRAKTIQAERAITIDNDPVVTYSQLEDLDDALIAETTRAIREETSLSNAVNARAMASDLDNYALKANLSAVATTGSYKDLSDTPTKVSEFKNDANYLDKDTYSTEMVGVINKLTSDINAEATARASADKANANALAAHTADTNNNPHKVTAAQVGALPGWNPYSGDDYWQLGYQYTNSQGQVTNETSLYINGNTYTTSLMTERIDFYDNALIYYDQPRLKFFSSGGCSFVSHFADDTIGETYDIESVLVPDGSPVITANALAAAISATNTTFSNAVLAVTTQFDTNTIAQINELIEDGTELPATGVASVGAALAAVFAALAALKKKQEATDAKVSAANTTLEEVA